ncbi:innexin inx2-like isoform X1 [Tigriopus californicus]|uniref:innexin inx2-like isoform X1 n=1 Tax=Tigriopus californicus TaxID=6832 RepID=UPI0027DA9C64|nr:innexin inx2-like isoform X1 [Tigriopus californicus]|eukprot:TCALIF_11214-PA protein Name:"Similar to inx2 Innexin inx2 (Schistocerca americana)" AED:0.05 eAED:0.05 QI:0/0/0/1/1/1/3/0/392
MFFQALGHFKGLFYNSSDAIIDDAIFKLHYVVSSTLLYFCVILVSGKAYLGDPIHCSTWAFDSAKVIQTEMLNSYCYIHSTFIIPGLSGETYPGLAPYQSKHQTQAIQQSYYQWVPLLLFLQGSTFLLPFFMWKQFENGLVKRLRLDLNDPSLPVQTRDEQISRLVLYFQTHTGRNMLYGKHFIYCIFFNFLNVMAQIYFTNLFLGGIFFMYGTNFSYGHSGVNEASSFEDIAFPKMSRCVLHVFGPSGTKQIIDALCVLPLNILHDKVYLVLWYWYGVLVLITLCNLIYWLIHYFFKQCRQSHIQRHLKGKTKGNELKPFNQNFGDWLVLHQVYKNIEHRHFTRLVSEMCKVESNGLRRSDTMIFDESKDSEDNDLEKDPLKRTEKKVVFQ